MLISNTIYCYLHGYFERTRIQTVAKLTGEAVTSPVNAEYEVLQTESSSLTFVFHVRRHNFSSRNALL